MKRFALLSLLLFVIVAGGMVSASTELYIFGTYGDIDSSVTEANLYRGESTNYSFYAKSTLGDFTVDTFISDSDCVARDVDVLLEESLDSVFVNAEPDYYEAGAQGLAVNASSLDPENYNLCLVADRVNGEDYDIASLSFNVLNHAPYFDGLDSSYFLDEDDVSVVLENLSTVSFDEDGDELTFSIDTSSTDESIVTCGVYNDEQGSLVCDVNGVGATSIVVAVNDGYDITSQEVTIEVGQINDAPTFGDMPESYSIDVSEHEEKEVVDIAEYVTDAEGDNITLDFDLSSVDNELANCEIRNDTVVFCEFTGKGGLTDFAVSASDYELTTTRVVGLNLYNDTFVVEPVAIIDGPVKVSTNEQVTYDASRSIGSFESEIVDYEWSVAGESAAGASFDVTFTQRGTYDLSLTVTDANNKSDSETITVVAGDDAQVIINAPDEVESDETFTLDGSRSTAASGLSIVEYEWTIETPSGTHIDTLFGDVVDYSLSTKGNYDIMLEITDSSGHTSVGTHSLSVVDAQRELSQYDPETGLKMISYSVYGNDFETAIPDRIFVVSVKVENFAGEDLDNIRLIYSIPELGIKFKSSAIDLDDGERKTITIQEYLPYFVEPGVYYPRIALSDDEIRRVKYGYLEVVEE
ncbi:MAG: PKD domain-containing protein [Nanobdellota archaeon]